MATTLSRLAPALLLAAAFTAQLCAMDSPSPAPASPAVGGGSKSEQAALKDLPYVTTGHERQRLDLYLPARNGTTRPLIIWIHGGGWQEGSKKDCPALPMVARGYAVASLGYRLSQDAVFPAQIEDCKAAVRWLRAHAAEYGIDPNRIGVWGHSAGGHLAALLGTTGNIRDFDRGENLDQSSAVQCVIDWCGPTDFLHYGNVTTAELDRPSSAVAKLLGAKIAVEPEKARQASPVYFVSAKAAPFLIMQGDRDPLVPVQQSQGLNDALKNAGADSTLKIIAGGGHGDGPFFSPENIQLMVSFCDRHLVNPASGTP